MTNNHEVLECDTKKTTVFDSKRITKKRVYDFFINFRKQTPKIRIGNNETDQLYERVFLSGDFENESLYSQNTTTWD